MKDIKTVLREKADLDRQIAMLRAVEIPIYQRGPMDKKRLAWELAIKSARARRRRLLSHHAADLKHKDRS